MKHGAVEHGFLRRLTMVCVVVFIASGLVVYWIDQATPDRASQPSQPRPEPAMGGGRCAR